MTSFIRGYLSIKREINQLNVEVIFKNYLAAYLHYFRNSVLSDREWELFNFYINVYK